MSNTELDIGYKPRDYMVPLHLDARKYRFSVWNLHRRCGKTYGVIPDQADNLLFLPYRQPQGVYIAPTYGQAERVAWDYYKLFLKVIPGTQFKESKLQIIIPRPHMHDEVKIWLLGAENPDSIRGMYLDDAILDEYASMNPTVWSKVVRPALTDRKGRARFIGTPQGENHFFDIYTAACDPELKDWCAHTITVEQSKIISEDELLSARKTMTEDEYNQEFMCSFSAALTGAYYSKYMDTAQNEGRICDLPHNPNAPVSTFWDLGISDSMAIWFLQKQGESYHAIDYLEEAGKGVEYYIREVYKRPYVYAKHYCPHDVKKRELSTGISLIDTMENLGLRPLFRVPKCTYKKDMINAVRMVIPMMKFDRIKCADGISALRNYQAEWDPKKQRFKDTPRHDWASHGSDALGCFAMGRDDSSFVPSYTLQSKLPTQAIMDYDELNF